MSLDALKPSKIEKRFKALFYGGPGLGKTLTSIQFPRPYVIDTEGGCENDEYVDILEKGEGVILKTLDFDQIRSNVRALRSEKHHYKTFILDSLSYLYSSLISDAEADPSIKGGMHGFLNYYREASVKIRKLMSDILRLDMNVIIICHKKEKVIDEKTGENEVKYDGPDKLDHMFDLTLRLEKDKGFNKLSSALITKSRCSSKFPEGTSIPFNFSELSSRYGEESFKRDAVTVNLATTEQLAQLDNLIVSLKVPFSVTNKWLKRARITQFSDMDTETIDKCIMHLIEKMNNNKNSEEEFYLTDKLMGIDNVLLRNDNIST